MLTALSQVEIFKPVPDETLAALAAQGRPRTFPSGSAVLRQGDEPESLYVILRGRVRVEYSHPSLAKPRAIAELGPGELVGEIGVLSGQNRTANAVAIEETDTLELDAAVVTQMMLRFPAVWSALLQLANSRLRRTREVIEQLETEQAIAEDSPA